MGSVHDARSAAQEARDAPARQRRIRGGVGAPQILALTHRIWGESGEVYGARQRACGAGQLPAALTEWIEE